MSAGNTSSVAMETDEEQKWSSTDYKENQQPKPTSILTPSSTASSSSSSSSVSFEDWWDSIPDSLRPTAKHIAQSCETMGLSSSVTASILQQLQHEPVLEIRARLQNLRGLNLTKEQYGRLCFDEYKQSLNPNHLITESAQQLSQDLSQLSQSSAAAPLHWSDRTVEDVDVGDPLGDQLTLVEQYYDLLQRPAREYDFDYGEDRHEREKYDLPEAAMQTRIRMQTRQLKDEAEVALRDARLAKAAKLADIYQMRTGLSLVQQEANNKNAADESDAPKEMMDVSTNSADTAFDDKAESLFLGGQAASAGVDSIQRARATGEAKKRILQLLREGREDEFEIKLLPLLDAPAREVLMSSRQKTSEDPGTLAACLEVIVRALEQYRKQHRLQTPSVEETVARQWKQHLVTLLPRTI